MEESLKKPDNSVKSVSSSAEMPVDSASPLATLEKLFHLKGPEPSLVSPLTLAYLGDAVFELAVRTILAEQSDASVHRLHRMATRIVNAENQSKMVAVLEAHFTEEEQRVYKRGRNAKSPTVAKNADIVDCFVPFDVNRKSLLAKMASALEKTAYSPEQTAQTGNMLQQLQDYLDGLAFEYPCDMIFPKLSISGIIKSAGPELRNEYGSIAEAVIDYMELVQTFDRERLFFTVNMRCFVPDGEMALFMSTALSHGYHLIMLESHAYPLLPLEQRTIVDEDLCEI